VTPKNFRSQSKRALSKAAGHDWISAQPLAATSSPAHKPDATRHAPAIWTQHDKLKQTPAHTNSAGLRFRTESASDPKLALLPSVGGRVVGEQRPRREGARESRNSKARQVQGGGGGGSGTHDVALVELALEVVDDVGAGGEVRRDEDVGPVVGPARVALVVVRRRRRPPRRSRTPPSLAGLGVGCGAFAARGREAWRRGEGAGRGAGERGRAWGRGAWRRVEGRGAGELGGGAAGRGEGGGAQGRVWPAAALGQEREALRVGGRRSEIDMRRNGPAQIFLG